MTVIAWDGKILAADRRMHFYSRIGGGVDTLTFKDDA